ncbi:flagellar biosynthetic protein FliQ [Erwinia amylovora]|nr:flagellar biosynthetic protein FliQ [Erwinia amylovora]MCK8370431.1 flagellar biosynthetic protein FliQ [Erwinia amylovora]
MNNTVVKSKADLCFVLKLTSVTVAFATLFGLVGGLFQTMMQIHEQS